MCCLADGAFTLLAAEPIVQAVPQAVKPVVGSVTTDDRLMWVVTRAADRKPSLGYRCGVRRPCSGFSRRGQRLATGWFCGSAVSNCRFRLRWHLGPNCGNGIPLASFPLCSFSGKITTWCQKLFLFSSAASSSALYLPEFSPLGLTCLVPHVINAEDHSADKLNSS